MQDVEVEEGDPRKKLSELGANFSSAVRDQFVHLAVSALRWGKIDITGWSEEPLRLLLSISHDQEMILSVKNGDREMTVMKPSPGPMLEWLVHDLLRSSSG